MNVDERIDRLTERHEALTQSIELLTIDISEVTRAAKDQWKQIHELSQIVRQSAASIDTLARIAEIHEHRLDELELDELEGE